jgi:hypothetical protein
VSILHYIFLFTQPLSSYGPKELYIISATLRNIFPPEDFRNHSFAPLAGMSDFTEWILVPEVTVALIMQDLGLTREQALRIRLESIDYGLGMFQDDQEGEEIVGEIMREVVTKKRAELMARDREEMDVDDGHRQPPLNS